MVIQELEQIVALFLLVARNASYKLLVYEESFLSSGRMGSDYGMSVGDRIAANDASSRQSIVGLFMT